MVKALTLMVLLIAGSGNALACRLALVLAIDVSKSVDSADYALQFQGLASAFRDDRVQAAILNRRDPVAVTAFEWSGAGHQAVVADWSLLVNIHHVELFALVLERHLRINRGQHTAIGSALVFSNRLFSQGPDCSRRVIDVSSDGYNNDGPAPRHVYGSHNFSNITVNALVIGGLRRPELKRYFENQVIHGPGAFALATQSFADYAEAIRQKLLRELRSSGAVAIAGKPP